MALGAWADCHSQAASSLSYTERITLSGKDCEAADSLETLWRRWRFYKLAQPRAGGLEQGSRREIKQGD